MSGRKPNPNPWSPNPNPEHLAMRDRRLGANELPCSPARVEPSDEAPHAEHGPDDERSAAKAAYRPPHEPCAHGDEHLQRIRHPAPAPLASGTSSGRGRADVRLYFVLSNRAILPQILGSLPEVIRSWCAHHHHHTPPKVFAERCTNARKWSALAITLSTARAVGRPALGSGIRPEAPLAPSLATFDRPAATPGT